MANANSTIEIELEIKQALDRLNKMQRELQKQADEFDKAGRASEKFERAVKASMSGAGSAIRKTLGAFTSLQAAVVGLASAYSAKEFIEFGAAYEREISKLNALTKATAEEQLLLRAAIREVGSSTAYTATQAAEAANVLAALGRSSQQITKELGVVVRVAGATSTEIELVAEAVAAQVNVFELSAKTVGDIFAAAYSTSAANVERLQIALAQVGPVAKAAGLDLYETVGAISFLVDRGFEASSAGTAIRGALTRLIDPSKEVEKVFAELGVSLLQIQKLSFEDQLQLIADKLQNVSTQAERNRILTQVFGVEALAAANNLVEAYGRGNRVLTEQAEKLKAATDAATLYDKITSDLRGAIDSLIAAVQDKLLTAFQTLEPLIKGVVDDLTKSISDLTTLDVVNAVGRLGKFLLTVAEEFYNAIRLAINSISQFLNSSQFSQLMDLAGRALSSLGFTSVEEDIARQEAVFFEALANYRSARADLERMQQELDPQDEGAQIQIASAQQIVDRLQQIMVQEHQRFLLMEAQAEKLREQYELLGPQDDAFAKANQRLDGALVKMRERVQLTDELLQKQKEVDKTAPGGVSADQVAAQIARATEEPLDRMTEKVQLASLATQRLADIINSDLSGPDKINQLEALSQAILDAVDPADFVALGVEAGDVYIKLIRLSEGADQVAQNLRKIGEQEIQQQGFLAAQQAMKELLRLGEEEKKQRQEVSDIIAGINLRGRETNEIEKLNRTYAAEISAIMLNTNYTLSQRVEIANALKDARDREAEGLEEALTYQEMITDELETQLGLSERAASAVVSGVFGAGPNAGRAGSIAQSQSLDEALVKLVFSNEEIAKSIDDVFAELFQLLDPILDKLADLVRLMGRLIDVIDDLVSAVEDIPGVQDAAEKAEDAFQKAENWFQDRIDWFTDNGGIFNVPQNTVLGQALGFAGLGGGGGGGGNQGPSQEEINAYYDALFNSALEANEMIYEIQQRNLELSRIEQVRLDYQNEMNEVLQEETLTKMDQDRVIRELIAARDLEVQKIIETSKKLADEQIADIERRGLIFSEQQEIEYRYAKEIAAAQENTNLTTADQIRLVNALEAARQREIDALERSSYLLDLQSAQSGLAEILRNFEDTIEGIRETVQGLFDQVNDLLFSEFNLMPAMDRFELASDQYATLLEQAFSPDATEEDIENLQGFVNEYLSAARDVYKSSSRFQSIFDQVLQDLTVLGLEYGFTAPINAVGVTRSDVAELGEELGVSMETLINELDQLAVEFANQQLEFIGEVIEVDFAEIISIEFPDDIDLGEITFTYSVEDIDLGMVTPTATLTADTIDFGEITPEFTIGDVDLGEVSATGDWASSTVNLGTVNATATFNTSGFVTALANAITAIQDAIDDATDVIGGGDGGSDGGGGDTGGDSVATTLSGLAYPARPLPLPFPLSDIETSTWTNYDSAVVERSSTRGVTQFLAQAIAENIATPREDYIIRYDWADTDYRYMHSYSDLARAEADYQFYLGFPQFYSNLTTFGFRQGGLVPDPMDTIPAMLSPGEYILSPETVRRFGVSSLNQLNSGDASAISQTNDPEVKRLLAELIQAVRESDTEVNVYTDMRGQAKAAVEEFRSEIKERSRRQGDQFIPVRYI